MSESSYHQKCSAGLALLFIVLQWFSHVYFDKTGCFYIGLFSEFTGSKETHYEYLRKAILLKPTTAKAFQGKKVPKNHGTGIENIAWEKLKRNISRKIAKLEFRKDVMESPALSLVKFKVEWSGACQILAPIYEELSNSYTGTANFFTIDVEKETGIGKEYGIIELPTILFFKYGKIVDHVAGLVPKNVMISKIENALSLT